MEIYATDDEGYSIISFASELPVPFTRNKMGKSSWLDCGTVPINLKPGSIQFKTLWNLHPDVHSEIVMYGKKVKIPRYQQSYLQDYKFSGAVSKQVPLPDEMLSYLKWANSLGYGDFQQVLVNWYQNGENYIGSHSDDESQLVENSPIVTITLCGPGEPRKFRIRAKDEQKTIQKDIETKNGDVLVMGGKFQKEFKHEIVKMTGKSALKAGARISITLRQFK